MRYHYLTPVRMAIIRISTMNAGGVWREGMPTKVCLVKAVVFPVVMYGYESWTIKKTERRGIDAFELWC